MSNSSRMYEDYMVALSDRQELVLRCELGKRLGQDDLQQFVPTVLGEEAVQLLDWTSANTCISSMVTYAKNQRRISDIVEAMRDREHFGWFCRAIVDSLLCTGVISLRDEWCLEQARKKHQGSAQTTV